ncbi:alkene reductase [Ruegeria pomeroyi]|uniref:NADH-dependent flavin oxidoreductase, Oye family n=2 Tax=Ruegeria pomeroyi TaxID=89184 RepID=Q5LQ81_RUEPO|nr:alkene reductase [Ruegeria pomeroyi]AAV95860.1 NADH-dependent flavin oxidoreductase, Oye family [Ruegeria pomeroyi DSS-3]NVK98274.1 alkene reductase [Ruegeria pomeroyi]NVK99758.1 alkene reductase [Ruegeria pomeroyi]QWV09430.1 alkene reductase [Ruegeria pomeroyi]
MSETLFTPLKAGNIALKNRVVMAPLTRNRADDTAGTVFDRHAEYYAQRASAGLLITEGAQISAEGKGYIQTPGIHTPEQVAAWRKVTDAVHARGGKIVIQLWHVGRISHSSLLPDGQAPVSPSAIAAEAKTFTHAGFETTSTPRALETDEIARVLADYAHAAQSAREAGFDGVEIHAANGYLVEQFLKDGANQRQDDYGGSVENRARFLFQVLEAVLTVWEPGNVGIRLSPFTTVNGISESDPVATYTPVIKRLDSYGLAYLHMIEGQTGGARDGAFDDLRQLWTGAYMGNNGYDRASALERTETGAVDLVAFGRPYIANPDLVERLAADAPLNMGDTATYYGGGDEGYTDYPVLQTA